MAHVNFKNVGNLNDPHWVTFEFTTNFHVFVCHEGPYVSTIRNKKYTHINAKGGATLREGSTLELMKS